MCAQEAICVPRFFSNFSETPFVKIGFEDFLRLMNEGRFLEGGRFHFLCLPRLKFTSTSGWPQT